MRQTAKITIVELAERLGVAKSTVSRALNGYPDISEAMRQRVREAAETHGYHPTNSARRLKRGRIGVVAVVVPPQDPTGDVWAVIEGAVPALARHGLDLLVAPNDRDEDPVQVYGRLLAARKADAFILVGEQAQGRGTEFLTARRAPFVAIGAGTPLHPGDGDGDVAWRAKGEVKKDLAETRLTERHLAARAAVDHALSARHTRIAFVQNADDGGDGDALTGFEAGFAEAGRQADPSLILRAAEANAASIAPLFEREAPPTVAICRSAALAEAAAHAARDASAPLSVICLRMLGERAPDAKAAEICVGPDGKALGAWAVEALMGRTVGSKPGEIPHFPPPLVVHGNLKDARTEPPIDDGADPGGLIGTAPARRPKNRSPRRQ